MELPKSLVINGEKYFLEEEVFGLCGALVKKVTQREINNVQESLDFVSGWLEKTKEVE